jgi:hypothetical protein
MLTLLLGQQLQAGEDVTSFSGFPAQSLVLKLLVKMAET